MTRMQTGGPNFPIRLLCAIRTIQGVEVLCVQDVAKLALSVSSPEWILLEINVVKCNSLAWCPSVCGAANIDDANLSTS